MSQYGINVWSNVRTCVAVAVLLAAASISVAAQQNEKPSPAKPATAAKKAADAKPKSWNLVVSKKIPRLISLKAVDAPLKDIAVELSRKIGVPVNLSPLMQKQNITLEFSGLPIDAAVRLLAPQPYIDYEASGDFSIPPKSLAIYLHGLNESAPSTNSAIRGGSEAVLIEGDTEEGTEEYEKRKEREELALSVSYTKNLLSVQAKKQPLSVVLYKIASELGIPFELRYEGSEMVDVNFKNYSVEQALRSISPSVHFFFRADLQTSEIQPLRIALVAPART